MTSLCAHLTADLPPVAPDSTNGCSDCLAIGGRWVHLRMCLECGHIACCDSSPNKHATAHFQASGHAVMTSREPGEHWRWCFVDEVGA